VPAEKDEFKSTKRTEINKVKMSEEDELLYRIKHGHAPKFRIEKEMIHEEGASSRVEFTLTNIPEEKD